MSRIQEILRKAERDGGVHRTRAASADVPSAANVVADRPEMEPVFAAVRLSAQRATTLLWLRRSQRPPLARHVRPLLFPEVTVRVATRQD